MSCKVSWYSAPHVILCVWVGKTTLEDIQNAVAAVRDMLVDAQAPVIILNDTADLSKPFMNMGLLRSTVRPLLEDERVIWLIAYYVQRPLVNFLVMMLARTFTLKARTFRSWENTRAFLETLDTGLDFSRVPIPPTIEASETVS